MARGKSRAARPVWQQPCPDAAGWLALHAGELFTCPHQPGNLKLLPQACANRHEIANQPRWNNLGGDSYDKYMIRVNLIPCRHCQIGARRLGGHVRGPGGPGDQAPGQATIGAPEAARVRPRTKRRQQ